jgi:hypothetical protein
MVIVEQLLEFKEFPFDFGTRISSNPKEYFALSI